MRAGAAPGPRVASASRAAVTARPGAAPGVGPPPLGAVLHQADLPAVDVGAVQFVQSPLHVRVRPELDHALVGALFVGVGISHLARLTHKILEVLPAAAARQVLHYEAVLSTDRGPVLVPARAAHAAAATAAAVSTATFNKNTTASQRTHKDRRHKSLGQFNHSELTNRHSG